MLRQARRPPPVPPLAIVLPHPALPTPRRRSSASNRISSSSSSSSPRTPSHNSPNCSTIFFTAPNRKSTDSWNSSNQGDYDDCEWKSEQVLLLSRTLDALPAHLLTPFHGSVPPSNLLDKIARGVAHAKGPNEWPHSIRATRVKLLELARANAKDENRRRAIVEEADECDIQNADAETGHDVLQSRTNMRPRMPLYRQSSMDFMNPAKTDITDNDNISRLSNRLQRTDRIIPNPAYHPYARPTRAPSPSHLVSMAHTNSLPSHVLNSSSSTLNSSSFLTSDNSTSTTSTLLTSASSIPMSAPQPPGMLRRAASSTFSSSSSSDMPLADPRIQHLRRSDSFCDPPPKRQLPLKRAPSYRGGTSGSSSSPEPSSDEEEKARTHLAKKLKTRAVTPQSAAPAPGSVVPSNHTNPSASPIQAPSTPSRSLRKPKSPPLTEPVLEKVKSKTKTKIPPLSPTQTPSPTKTSRIPRPRANVQRNPSILGAELPQLPPQPQSPPPRAPLLATHPSVNTQVLGVRSNLPHTHTHANVAGSGRPPPVRSPPRLRRVPATSFGRRISFGSLGAPREDDGNAMDVEVGTLGSAFQLA